jgi:hypothetical protein
MKKFHISADFIFEAYSLEDAFNKLAEHFTVLTTEDNDSKLIISGTCEIKELSESQGVSDL